jgi:hypothetical protein
MEKWELTKIEELDEGKKSQVELNNPFKGHLMLFVRSESGFTYQSTSAVEKITMPDENDKDLLLIHTQNSIYRLKKTT